MLVEQGICTEDGPLCFENYIQIGLSCNACQEGYKMKGVRCVSESSQVCVIIGGVMGGILAIALIAVLVYLCVKR